MAYAHTHTSEPQESWEPLEMHLDRVARGTPTFPGARGFAGKFGAADIGEHAGRWHDIGKFAPQFQSYLEASHAGRSAKSVDHSTAGALHAERSGITSIAREILAFVIAGHHTGLADCSSYGEAVSRTNLMDRLRKLRPETRDALKAAPDHILRVNTLSTPSWLTSKSPVTSLERSMFCRMIFSCLIDADRLATEWFMDSARHASRPREHPTAAQLLDALNHYMRRFDHLDRPATPVDRIRDELLHACRSASDRPPGIFTLTAPTGSGKTLSSMTFALSHARRHGLERVIYALPFTSVTEQNAAVFRAAFASLGEGVVLEHHSAHGDPSSDQRGCAVAPTESRRVARAKLIDSGSEIDDRSHAQIQRDLMIENWDAPVIVTTNVQLLESLFASDTRRCRKLHRIARSVIILDEAQALPVDLLAPTIAALRELVEHYGVSVVLCSATMPALLNREGFHIGFEPDRVTEIVPDPPAMSSAMRRVEVRCAGVMQNAELCGEISRRGQALVIVNTRRHAADIFRAVRASCPDAHHLSATMCPAHRADRVEEIRRRLKAHEPCRVVSTQVVEAGVDLDFPAVYRAMAGLDSIIQAAGRCNREGGPDRGEVIVFETDPAESGKPPPDIAQAAARTREILDADVDPLDLETIERYFRLHIWQNGGDAPQWDGPARVRKFGGITGLLHKMQFESADLAYEVIDNPSESIVVPYGDFGTQLCDDIRSCHAFEPGHRRRLLRAAQRFTVGVRRWTLAQLAERSLVMLTECGVLVLNPEAYDDDLGVRADAVVDPERAFA